MSDRLRRLETLYHRARALRPDERAKYLADECGADEEMRREVESLIAQQGGGFPSNDRGTPLASGAVIGTYRIIERIDGGGMGDVYRAHDINLERDVAVKVLRREFSSDPDRLARLKREARLLALLNHTNIAHVYGLEESDGTRALVMELIEGDTLADRIADGPIPLGEALPIARQIAAALAVAHDHGIIHRDLKPANIKLRPDATVKVLDFGLAKAVDATIESSATEPGAILGTVAYMSPEQAAGKPVDRRTDLWAFGIVLMEMLTGRRMFEGDSVAHVLAMVLEPKPDWSALPPHTPTSVRRLLRRCLVKDPTQRLDSATAVRLELDDDSNPAAPEPASSSLPSSAITPRPPVPVRTHLGWLAACLLTAGAVWAITVWTKNRSPIPAHAEITTPPTNDLVSLALSPDGEKLVFVAWADHHPKLFLRSLKTGSVQLLPNTDGARLPFWSPDSRSVGFFASGKVTTINVEDGSRHELAAAPAGVGGAWNRDGDILFTPAPDAPLRRVSQEGGAADWLHDPQAGGRSGGGQRFPQFLPDGRHFLYFVASDGPERGVYAGSLDEPQSQRLFDADAAAGFVPPDRVLFVRANKLYVQRFNTATRQLEGEAGSIAEGISIESSSGAAAISGSGTGTIVFRTGSVNERGQLAWFDRSGTPIGDAPEASGGNPALSRDGRFLAVSRPGNGNTNIWTFDLVRGGGPSKFIADTGPELYPVWSPDGTKIVYARITLPSPSGVKIYVKEFGRAGEEASLFEPSQKTAVFPQDWSPDGQFLSYIVTNSTGRWHLGVLRLEYSGKSYQPAKPVEITDNTSFSFNERGGQFSREGDLIAFASDRTGRYEIYVQPFPGVGGEQKVSSAGGVQPMWTRTPHGRELFYVAPNGQMMAVSITVTSRGEVNAASPIPLFPTGISTTANGGTRNEYIVAPNGRFLMEPFVVEQNAAPITLVLNLATPKD